MADDSGARGGGKLPTHILPIAGTMLGITTTLIGLVKLLEAQTGSSRVDEFGGIVGAIFLLSALASYAAIRSEDRAGLSRRLERTADALFLAGLICLTVLSLFFAYELI